MTCPPAALPPPGLAGSGPMRIMASSMEAGIELMSSAATLGCCWYRGDDDPPPPSTPVRLPLLEVDFEVHP